jgi:hypothetical protein
MNPDLSRQTTALKKPPEYFERVLRDTTTRWDQLDSDPDLAGPWRQLFSQVQSPRHVLSELLQNADDAGAASARVSISDGCFEFEHDGADFTPEQFQSLCRFGCSNKRVLHTIGFRGIGFKATFSLGSSVEVHSPTLAVRFDKKRFTQPTWIEGRFVPTSTLVRVRIEDEHREQELRKNLREWINSPASLLFFSNIRRLDIDGINIERKVLGLGPVANSQWVDLAGATCHQILLARSAEEEFPADALEEIRNERLAKDVTLPPCRVELIWGLTGDQRLYVVLPTGVRPQLPFSCNAPFVQDPARMMIKDPSVSPTNRWLLKRLGTLAARVMQGWLGNGSLNSSERAEAYYLLPGLATEGDSIAASTTKLVCESFAEAVDDGAVLLTSQGKVAPPQTCFAPPLALYDIWEPEALIAAFAPPRQELLARSVNEFQRNRLVQWKWLEQTPASRICESLEQNLEPPKPASNRGLVALWRFIQKNMASDYGGQRRRTLSIVPVENEDRLFRADSVVRLQSNRRSLQESDWSFLLGHVRVVDDGWLQYLSPDVEEPASFALRTERAELDVCRALLKDLGLADSTPISRVVQHAAKSLFGDEAVAHEDCVRFAHILAALDVDAPPDTEYVTRDSFRRSIHDGIMWADADLADLVPDEWAAMNILHPDYATASTTCSFEQWRSWSQSTKSGLRSFAVLTTQTSKLSSRRDLENLIRSRGSTPPSSYHYKYPDLTCVDVDFDERLLEYWMERAKSDASCWSRVVERLLTGPASEWSSSLYSKLSETSSSKTTRPMNCEPVPARWIDRLRSLPCLTDTFGKPHVPAELLIRTPETEPLFGVEPFVEPNADREETKPLLLLLGCRNTPAGVDSILDRIRALATIQTPPLRELTKWYDALDRVIARRRPNDVSALQRAFAAERLIYSAHGDWVLSREVFQRTTIDDPPDIPVLHSEFATLAMWTVVGVADRPSPDLVINFLKGWQSGRKLDGNELRRLRSILPQLPSRIWEECDHWLSLDGSWEPVESFDFVLFDDSSIRVRELFPSVKQRTADCRSLFLDGRRLPGFANLRDLGQTITFRLGRKQTDLPPSTTKVWLRALGRAFSRMQLPDPKQQSHVRDAGRTLLLTRWQPFRDLAVTPCIDGVPAGQDHDPQVLWDDTTLFVRQTTSAKILDAVVAEVGRRFPGDAFAKAIRSCFERDEAFVRDYMDSQFSFELEDVGPASITPNIERDRGIHDAEHREPLVTERIRTVETFTQAPRVSIASSSSEAGKLTEQPTDAQQIDASAPSPTAVIAGDDEEVDRSDDVGGQPAQTSTAAVATDQDERLEDPSQGLPESQAEPEPAPEPSRQQRERKPHDVDANPPLIARFVAERGFRWNGTLKTYTHADGTYIEEAEGLFPWEHRSGERILCRYWVSEQCLTKGGVELGVDLWNLIYKSPDLTALVLVDEQDRPVKILGADIVKMVQDDSVRVFPAKYRLRKPTPE